MGRGTILGGLGEGRYSIKVDSGKAERDRRIAALNADIADVDANLSQLRERRDQAAQEVAEKRGVADAAIQALADYNNENAAPPELMVGDKLEDLRRLKDSEWRRLTDAATKATTALVKAQGKLANLNSAIKVEEAKRAEIVKQRDALANTPVERELDAWCVDYTLDGSGEVATIEVPGEPQATLIAPGAREPTAGDGKLVARGLMSPEQLFWNVAVLPGWQKWKPTYRKGTLTAVDKATNRASVTLDEETSTEQRLGVNQSGGFASIPVQYMTCNAAVFEVGDRVVVQFGGMDWANPAIIGFVENPKPCSLLAIIVNTTAGQFLLYRRPEGTSGELVWDSRPSSGVSFGLNGYFVHEESGSAISWNQHQIFFSTSRPNALIPGGTLFVTSGTNKIVGAYYDGNMIRVFVSRRASSPNSARVFTAFERVGNGILAQYTTLQTPALRYHNVDLEWPHYVPFDQLGFVDYADYLGSITLNASQFTFTQSPWIEQSGSYGTTVYNYTLAIVDPCGKITTSINYSAYDNNSRTWTSEFKSGGRTFTVSMSTSWEQDINYTFSGGCNVSNRLYESLRTQQQTISVPEFGIEYTNTSSGGETHTEFTQRTAFNYGAGRSFLIYHDPNHREYAILAVAVQFFSAGSAPADITTDALNATGGYTSEMGETISSNYFVSYYIIRNGVVGEEIHRGPLSHSTQWTPVSDPPSSDGTRPPGTYDFSGSPTSYSPNITTWLGLVPIRFIATVLPALPDGSALIDFLLTVGGTTVDFEELNHGGVLSELIGEGVKINNASVVQIS
jgi:hypothetical protein